MNSDKHRLTLPVTGVDNTAKNDIKISKIEVDCINTNIINEKNVSKNEILTSDVEITSPSPEELGNVQSPHLKGLNSKNEIINYKIFHEGKANMIWKSAK